jgi:hypothetical protein
MQPDADVSAPAAPLSAQREVNLVGDDVGQPVELGRGLVGNDRLFGTRGDPFRAT